MKTIHSFNHEHYHNALRSQIFAQHVPQYHRQRGGGLGGIITGMSQYVIPVTKKYILPEIKQAAIRTFDDVIEGTPITNALIRNTKTLIENVGKNIAQSSSGQQGGSLSRKRKTTSYKPVKKTVQRKKKKIVKTKVTKKKTIKNKCGSRCISKKDIFS